MKFAISAMQLASPAFDEGARIPAKYTGEGEDTSPAFEWSPVPEGTQSFALICHDPDAPVVSAGGYGFVHWVLYNIPGAAEGLPEGVSEFTSGPNDFGKPGYGGPMPPNGHGTHRYFFSLLALGCEPNLEPGLTMGQLLETTEAHLIGMNRLMGTYERE
jgi:Raf kinase inhibitor-like YbhB/YbcL family protein